MKLRFLVFSKNRIAVYWLYEVADWFAEKGINVKSNRFRREIFVGDTVIRFVVYDPDELYLVGIKECKVFYSAENKLEKNFEDTIKEILQ